MRAFIIGNGASLTLDQLELLKDEVTFGVNQIHLLYKGLPEEWRMTKEERESPPSYSIYSGPRPFRKLQDLNIQPHVKHFVWMEWSGHDDILWREAVGVHLSLGCVCHLSAGHRGHYLNNRMSRFEVPQTRTEFYELCQHGNNQPGEPEFRPDTWHLPSLCRYGGSLSAAMQIAVREGYGPLYLVGCDLGFKGEGADHFHPDYGVGARRIPPEMQADRTLKAHNIAFKSSPVLIYNATRGGELETYPRVKLEDVLSGHIRSDTPDNRPDIADVISQREEIPVGPKRSVSRKKPGGGRGAARKVRPQVDGR